MERPLTIHGLQAKRCQLTRLHRQLEDEAAQLLKDIEHVDACLRLFDPEIQLKRVCFTRKHKNPPAPKGQLRRFILDQLRAADEPLTSRGLIDAWGKTHGTPDGTVKHRYLVKRISATIQGAKRSGSVECVGRRDGCNLYRLVKWRDSNEKIG